MPPQPPTWSPWRPFPNPYKGGVLTAPFGAGLYELRRRSTRRLVLIGISDHVAHRMTSLLPSNKGGRGTRNNSRKRAYVARHRNDIEYRTAPTRTRAEAQSIETHRRRELDYAFGT
ncbi:MAG: hypothetical protein H6813_06320 [Phycisphaeraceae bacterium]|nr:hypothetical protein [Phycisphaeraceae bacterium]MCB9848086.1 hypothetical protein [Phycisphaeraceae bacterium]